MGEGCDFSARISSKMTKQFIHSWSFLSFLYDSSRPFCSTLGSRPMMARKFQRSRGLGWVIIAIAIVAFSAKDNAFIGELNLRQNSEWTRQQSLQDQLNRMGQTRPMRQMQPMQLYKTSRTLPLTRSMGLDCSLSTCLVGSLLWSLGVYTVLVALLKSCLQRQLGVQQSLHFWRMYGSQIFWSPMWHLDTLWYPLIL